MGRRNRPNIKTSLPGVTCSSLGMIAGSAAEAANNYTKLSSAAVSGQTIIVDGDYHLDADTVAVAVSKLILIGTNRNTCRLRLYAGNYFDLTGTTVASKGVALCRNISIEVVSGSPIFINQTAPFVNEMRFETCYVTGDIRLVGCTVGNNYDFVNNDCWVENLTLDSCLFYDVRRTSGTSAIIYLNDVPIKLAHIKNCIVKNFSYIFYLNGVTNGNTSANYIYSNTNVIVENNVVYCTDDYDAYTRNNNAYSGVYYCFALVEGNTAVCRDNYFSGFHIADTTQMMCYDNYFTVNTLVYERNIWCNIVNFTPDISYVDIMKSKFASGTNSSRLYRHNKYVVEPSYADRFGKDRLMLRKQINTYQSDIDDIIIEDNYFDMYILSFFHGGLIYFRKSYRFNRNTVLMDTMEHITRQALIAIYDKKDGEGNFISRIAEVKDNVIIANTPAFGDGIGDQKFYLIMPYWNTAIQNKVHAGDKTSVVMTGNIITVDNGIVYTSEAAEVAKFVDSLGTADISGNTITVLS